MSEDDARQQEEMERERMERGLDVLSRVQRGMTTMDDVWFLASELGLTNEFRHTQQRRAA